MLGDSGQNRPNGVCDKGIFFTLFFFSIILLRDDINSILSSSSPDRATKANSSGELEEICTLALWGVCWSGALASSSFHHASILIRASSI